MIDCYLGDASGVLSCPFWSTVLECFTRLQIRTLNYWTVRICRTKPCVNLNYWTLLIVDQWQYYICCTRSAVTRYTLFMVLDLSRMCQWCLHAVLWSHIGTLMRLLAAEPRSPQYFYSYISISVGRSWWPRTPWCGTGRFQEQGQCLFIGIVACTLLSHKVFPFSIQGLRSSDWEGVNHSLPALHCQPF